MVKSTTNEQLRQAKQQIIEAQASVVLEKIKGSRSRSFQYSSAYNLEDMARLGIKGAALRVTLEYLVAQGKLTTVADRWGVKFVPVEEGDGK